MSSEKEWEEIKGRLFEIIREQWERVEGNWVQCNAVTSSFSSSSGGKMDVVLKLAQRTFNNKNMDWPELLRKVGGSKLIWKDARYRVLDDRFIKKPLGVNEVDKEVLEKWTELKQNEVFFRLSGHNHKLHQNRACPALSHSSEIRVGILPKEQDFCGRCFAISSDLLCEWTPELEGKLPQNIDPDSNKKTRLDEQHTMKEEGMVEDRLQDWKSFFREKWHNLRQRKQDSYLFQLLGKKENTRESGWFDDFSNTFFPELSSISKSFKIPPFHHLFLDIFLFGRSFQTKRSDVTVFDFIVDLAEGFGLEGNVPVCLKLLNIVLDDDDSFFPALKCKFDYCDQENDDLLKRIVEIGIENKVGHSLGKYVDELSEKTGPPFRNEYHKTTFIYHKAKKYLQKAFPNSIIQCSFRKHRIEVILLKEDNSLTLEDFELPFGPYSVNVCFLHGGIVKNLVSRSFSPSISGATKSL